MPSIQLQGTFGALVIAVDPRGGAGCLTRSTLMVDDDQSPLYGALAALESLVLAHACEGVDAQSQAYLRGLETAYDACVNNLGDDE